jgi:hypothetical protein
MNLAKNFSNEGVTGRRSCALRIPDFRLLGRAFRDFRHHNIFHDKL